MGNAAVGGRRQRSAGIAPAFADDWDIGPRNRNFNAKWRLFRRSLETA